MVFAVGFGTALSLAACTSLGVANGKDVGMVVTAKRHCGFQSSLFHWLLEKKVFVEVYPT